MRHGLPELLCNEGHEGMRKLEESIKGIHQHLHASHHHHQLSSTPPPAQPTTKPQQGDRGVTKHGGTKHQAGGY